MFTNMVKSSIVWGYKGKDRLILIIFFLRQEFEEALEWHPIKYLKEIGFSDRKVIADNIKDI
jgi:hypothetical protein